jgi:hypothetical protein
MGLPSPSHLTPFLPPMDKKLLWEILVGISAFSFWVFIIWFSIFALPGIANADDVASLRKDQKEERILQIHTEFCRAEQGSDQAEYFLQRRNELITEYSNITNGVDRFDTSKLPPCDILRPQEVRGE